MGTRGTRILTVVLAACVWVEIVQAASPFDDAVAAWHMANVNDAAGANSSLEAHGTVHTGVALEGSEREASLRRGGDGIVAECNEGWLDAGQGANGELNLAGEAMSLCIRLRDPSGKWDTSLFSKHGGHDRLVYNLFTADLGAGMIFGFELGIEGRAGMIQVKAPVAETGPEAWHDVIARCTGETLELYVDGVLFDARPARGGLRQGNAEPCLIGAESSGGSPVRPFRGAIDHAVLWDRALDDAEIIELSGGIEEVSQRRTVREEARMKKEQAMMERLANDPYRPQYHFLPERFWMNDPNGLIEWRGEYHLFYQKNPFGPQWGNMHWGHAVSKDLVRWEHLPIALAPTEGGPDEGGVFSGCAVDCDGTPVLVYTGVAPEVQCIAFGNESMRAFTKYEGNPVIAGPPEGLDVTGFRDPCVWREEDSWHMAVGSGIRDKGGAALLYASPDLKTWTYHQPILVGDKNSTGEMWECPDLFPLGDRHVLLVSVLGTVLYFTGDYRDGVFTPVHQGNTDFGGHFYAAQAFRDERGRDILFGWMWEGRSAAAQTEAGWAGVQSLPRVLSLRLDGSLGYRPAEELEALRDRQWSYTDIPLAPGSSNHVPDVQGKCLELHARIDPGTASRIVVSVLRSPGGEEETLVEYDPAAGQIRVNRDKASSSPEQTKGISGGAFVLEEGELLDLRIFVDCSVVEVFANGKACLTTRVYPVREDSTGADIIAEGGNATLVSCDAWTMQSIWKP